MKACKHPFLPELVASFSDDETLYLLLELIQGGDLFSMLRSARRFEEPVAAFYSGAVVLIFEYLHDRKIVYRDLRPENLMLDACGYPKLIDFGIAKEVPTKTWTLCGSPEYLAPEVVLNQGHNRSADWWALGVLLYELLMGVTPFGAEDDPMLTYQNIVKGVLPAALKTKKGVSGHAHNIISRLLHKKPTERLGCMRLGSQEVKRHPFFAKLSWAKLEKKQLQAPFVPKVRALARTAPTSAARACSARACIPPRGPLPLSRAATPSPP